MSPYQWVSLPSAPPSELERKPVWGGMALLWLGDPVGSGWWRCPLLQCPGCLKSGSGPSECMAFRPQMLGRACGVGMAGTHPDMQGATTSPSCPSVILAGSLVQHLAWAKAATRVMGSMEENGRADWLWAGRARPKTGLQCTSGLSLPQAHSELPLPQSHMPAPCPAWIWECPALAWVPALARSQNLWGFWGLRGAPGARAHRVHHQAAHPDRLPAAGLRAQSAGALHGAAGPVPPQDWDREVWLGWQWEVASAHRKGRRMVGS